MNILNKYTLAMLFLGVILTLYGFLSRAINLFFFWESKPIGWILILMGIIGFLFDRVKRKNRSNKKSILEKVGIGIGIFVIIIRVLLMIVIPRTDAYHTAKDFITKDEILAKELGRIKSFGFIYSGGIEKTIDEQGTYGTATINLIVKGQKRYKDISVYVVKYADRDTWEVVSVE